MLGLSDSNSTFLCEGFEEVKMACCGSGPLRGSLLTCGQKVYQLCDNVSEYFFFDGFHPTEKANYQFAKLMWDGSPKIVKPYNLKTLFKKSLKTYSQTGDDFDYPFCTWNMTEFHASKLSRFRL